MTPTDLDALALLTPFKAWHLHRYTQPFDEGRVEDAVYVCSILVGGEWTRDGFGATPEVAVRRALGEDI